MASDKIQNLETSTFDSAISSTDSVVLVDFWAAWCGPCKAIAPILDELADELDGKVKIFKIDVDVNKELASKFAVRAIPTMFIFKGGNKVEEIVGLLNKADLKSKLEAHC